MKRISISLDEADKLWLAAAAAREAITATELVRRAVRLLRERESIERQSFNETLQRTQGLLRGGDSLEYQTRLRNEW